MLFQLVYLQGEEVNIGRYRVEAGCSNNQEKQLAILKVLEWLKVNVLEGEIIRIFTQSHITLDSMQDVTNHFPLIEVMRQR